MLNRVNNVSFGARLQTRMTTPEAKLFMEAAPEFEKRTKKDHPYMTMYLKPDPLNPEFPQFTIGGEMEYVNNISNDFLKFENSKNKKELVDKLVKTFKILVVDKELMEKVDLYDDKKVKRYVKKMEKIAGKDEGLQGFIDAVKAGLDVEI